MDDDGRKVGEVAAATGLTVRTLHHYDEIGLLPASGRTPSGHRLYSAADLERLYRICLLRRIGFPLSEIGQVLDDPSWDIQASLGHHQHQIDLRMEAEGRLRRRLAHMASSLDDAGPATRDLLEVLEEMTMLDTTVQRRIGILVYEDLEAMHGFLVRAFGLGPGTLTRDDEGRVVHVELQAGDGVLWLHPEAPDFALASPHRSGTSTGSTAVMVEDVDAHHRHAVAEGVEVVYEPVDQPYGYREYSARDPEGGLWSFMRLLG